MLAAAVGSYCEAAPPQALRPHIACTWIYHLPDRNAGPIIAVPDGSIELRWIDGRLSIDGPHRSAIAEARAAGALEIGLRFQPGAAPHWLGLPASDLVDRCVALEDLWGDQARQLALWAGEARTPRGILHRLEASLSMRAAATGPVDAEMRQIVALLAATRAAPNASVVAVARRIGISEHTLRRRCTAAVGYGPRTLGRILRFQHFLHLVARSTGAPTLAGSADEAGYADQAHLSREAQRLSGLSPRAIMVQLAQ
jgi:AraC-like DNA-binding protein